MSSPIPASRGRGLREALPALLGICRRMNAERDLSVLPHLIAQEATRLLDADRASLFLLDREAGEFVSWVALGSDPIRFDARLGVAGAVAETGETVNVPDARRDRRFYAAVDARGGYETTALLAVPLLNADGDVIGVFEVLNKREGPFTSDDEEIVTALAPHAAIALETAQIVLELRRDREALRRENRELRREVRGQYATQRILGTSELVRENVRMIDQIRDTTANVLITGDSGTGKELVAKAVHYSSQNAEAPFVALNCAALPDNLVESELFGIEKGVATGVEKRIGRFEQADGGTLFLDEIGDLPLASQAKILRVLQESVVERVGGTAPIPIRVRVIAATHKDLEREIAEERFREDLYYRLKVISLRTPSLREIPADVPLLVHHFLARLCAEVGVEPIEPSPEAMSQLVGYAWPGNVRELENEMRRLVALVRGPVIEPRDLSESIRRAAPREPTAPSLGSLKERVEALERELVRDALEACGGNNARAARRLGLSRQGLLKKLKRFEMAPPSTAARAPAPAP